MARYCCYSESNNAIDCCGRMFMAYGTGYQKSSMSLVKDLLTLNHMGELDIETEIDRSSIHSPNGYTIWGWTRLKPETRSFVWVNDVVWDQG